jgi:trk system potassium uptake protein TrkH
MLFPVAWSAWARDGGLLPLALGLAAGMSLCGGMYLAGRGSRLADMGVREAILSVVGTWMTASAIVGLPYFFSGAVPNLLDALFEGVSGFTTTGASVIKDLGGVPRSILLWRSFSQWIGGIGVVVLTLALLPMSGAGMQLYKAEVSGPTHERLTPRIQQTAAFLCKTYLALTCAQALLLSAGGLDIFDSLTLSFSTLATGGFSPYRENVGHFSGAYVKCVTAVFLFLSASSLTAFHAVIAKRSLSPLKGNPEMKFYAAALLSFGTAASLLLYAGGTFASPAKSLAEGFFHTVSTLSTCGFFTSDYNEWPASVRLLMLTMMFCGGCAASTAGGITCVRALVVLRHIGAEFVRRMHPRAIVPTRLDGSSSPIEMNVIAACFAYVAAYMAAFCAGFALLALLGQDMASSISGVAATLGNVGPGFGMTGASAGYADLPGAVKAVYMFLMLCGRLEIFTLAAVFAPQFWRG